MSEIPPNPLPCGCRVQYRFWDGGGAIDGSGYVQHCPLHAAAERLLAWGVERIEENHDRDRSKCWCADMPQNDGKEADLLCDHCLDIQFRDDALAAIAKAKGE